VATNQTPTIRNKIRKRVKTLEDFKPINKNIKSSNIQGIYSPRVKNSKISATTCAQKTFSPAKKQATNPQSPRKEIKNPLLKNLLSRKSIALNTESEDEEMDKNLKSAKPKSGNSSPVKANFEAKKIVKNVTDNDEENKIQKLVENVSNENESKLLDETSSVLLNISNKLSPVKKMQHLEFQNRIQKQRQEMRLQREKNFNEIKSQFKQTIPSELEIKDIESKVLNVFIPTHLTCKLYYLK
jgi:hypothetical protein